MDNVSLNINGENLTLLISSDEIQRKVDGIASVLKERLGEEAPLFLPVLNGAFVFASDLVRAYKGVCNIEFVRYKSYCGERTTGKIETLLGVPDCVKGRTVVVVEDIVDTGITMAHLLEQIKLHEPKDIIVVCLFSKPCRRIMDVRVDYYCFDIPDKFIVGYGLDYDGLYRNLPAVYYRK